MHEIVYVAVAGLSALISTVQIIANLKLRAAMAEFRGKVMKDVDEKYLPRETFSVELKRIEEHLAR